MDSSAAKELLEALIQEIGREEFIAILKAVILWGLAGAILGLVIGFGVYRGFRRLQWYAASSTAGRWTQRTVFVVGTLASILLFGAAGAWEGVRQKCEPVLARSRLGTEGLPVFANYVAESLVLLDLGLQQGSIPDEAAEEAHLAAFRTGTRELDAPGFLQRVGAVRQEVFQQLLRQLEEYLLQEAPALKGGYGEKILHHAVQELGPALLDQKLSQEIRKRNLGPLHVALRDRLVAAAARTGNPATIGYRDLSAFILREGMIPSLVEPVRTFARQQQILYIAIALLCCLTPPPIFRLCRKTPEPGPADP